MMKAQDHCHQYYDHVCILYGHMEPDIEEFEAMYEKIETDDEGDITIKKVVEHIRAVEAGGGNNEWVNNQQGKAHKFPKLSSTSGQ